MNNNKVVDVSWEDEDMYAEEAEDEEERFLRESGYLEEPAAAPPAPPQAPASRAKEAGGLKRAPDDDEDDESEGDAPSTASSGEVTEPTEKKKPSGELSDEQKGILREVMEGKNVYYSGRAGSGKSHLLRAIIERAPAGKTFITASTGIAAINVGGESREPP